MRKIISLVLAVAMILSLGMTSFATAAKTTKTASTVKTWLTVSNNKLTISNGNVAFYPYQLSKTKTAMMIRNIDGENCVQFTDSLGKARLVSLGNQKRVVLNGKFPSMTIGNSVKSLAMTFAANVGIGRLTVNGKANVGINSKMAITELAVNGAATVNVAKGAKITRATASAAANVNVPSNVVNVKKTATTATTSSNTSFKFGSSSSGSSSSSHHHEAATSKDVTPTELDTAAIDTAIEAANAAKKDVEISANGEKVLDINEWVTQDVNDALDTAIKTATDAKATVKTADEVTAAADKLDTAVGTYNGAKKPGKTEATPEQKLEAAKKDAKAAADDLLTGLTEADYTADSWSALTDAIAADKLAIDGKTSVEEVTGYTLTATAAKAALVEVAVDTKALNEAIAAANTVADEIVVDTDAANVADGTKWILKADKTTYTEAIAAADLIAKKADATQEEVDAAVATLATATTAFEKAQKDGTKAATVDTKALNEAIAAANTVADEIVVDTDAANVADGTKWILKADKTTYTEAIAAADLIAKKADATQEEVDAAVATLATATTAFEKAQKDGTKVVVDTKVLNEAIAAANTAADEIVVDTDAANVADGTKWILKADKTTYTEAIAAADLIAKKADATQEEVDAAVATLATATTAFEKAQKDGTKA